MKVSLLTFIVHAYPNVVRGTLLQANEFDIVLTYLNFHCSLRVACCYCRLILMLMRIDFCSRAYYLQFRPMCNVFNVNAIVYANVKVPVPKTSAISPCSQTCYTYLLNT